MAATVSLRAYIPELFARLGVKTFLDSPCGDWNWMRLVDLKGIQYIGADVVPAIVEQNHKMYAGPERSVYRRRPDQRRFAARGLDTMSRLLASPIF